MTKDEFILHYVSHRMEQVEPEQWAWVRRSDMLHDLDRLLDTMIPVPNGESLQDAYVKLWQAYQTLAITFHQKTKQLEAELDDLRRSA